MLKVKLKSNYVKKRGKIIKSYQHKINFFSKLPNMRYRVSKSLILKPIFCNEIFLQLLEKKNVEKWVIKVSNRGIFNRQIFTTELKIYCRV